MSMTNHTISCCNFDIKDRKQHELLLCFFFKKKLWYSNVKNMQNWKKINIVKIFLVKLKKKIKFYHWCEKIEVICLNRSLRISTLFMTLQSFLDCTQFVIYRHPKRTFMIDIG